MQSLLPVVKTQLQGLSQLKRRQDAYISPYENFMPTGARPPCIGIVPGQVTRTELTSSMVEKRLGVRLAGYVPMESDGEAVLCGDGGVYALLDAACGLLTDDGLAVPGLQLVEIGIDRPSELFMTDNKVWLVKVVRELTVVVEQPMF